ncbi:MULTISPECIES: hexameric tyrosine-coordinated heme protein [unclassified Nostoc]|nr:hexameric tyrosine-coordinated heme protein [Nostoc sp. DedQUE03]MDZ7974274.1 hexameric tyrosine-coordinated heme protein [Nostoc sp. DedQUE03]MDZ8043569.1 hexameric tyrosine-coordinated heme protein [Nostoc sp. DedQUE02]
MKKNEEKRNQLRDVYGNDAMIVIAVGQTVATFATIAATNNYWRK